MFLPPKPGASGASAARTGERLAQSGPAWRGMFASKHPASCTLTINAFFTECAPLDYSFGSDYSRCSKIHMMAIQTFGSGSGLSSIIIAIRNKAAPFGNALIAMQATLQRVARFVNL